MLGGCLALSPLTLQLVPDIVRPLLDLGSELLQVVLGFWVNKGQQNQSEETEGFISDNNRWRRCGAFSAAQGSTYPGAPQTAVIRTQEAYCLKAFSQAPWPRPTE